MMPIGTIVPYGGNISQQNVMTSLDDGGWILCDGAEVDRDKYHKLFDIIGEAFGTGGGKTKFNVPDLRGQFVRGLDYLKEGENRPYRDPDIHQRKHPIIKDKEVGGIVGSMQMDGLKSHQHSLSNTINKFHRRFQGTGNQRENGIPLTSDAGTVWLEKETSLYGEQETRPKNVYVNFIIKALP